MSWIFGGLYERKGYTDKLDVDFRIANDSDEEVVESCSCAYVGKKINAVINGLTTPIFVFLRTIADFQMRNSPDIVQIPFTKYTYHCTRNPAVTREILKHHRCDTSEKGMFSETHLGKGITIVGNKIFLPKEPIVPNDNILACDRQDHYQYSNFLKQFFNPQSVKKHLESIETIIDETLSLFQKEPQEFVINEKIKYLATTIMAKVFLGIHINEDLSTATSKMIPWISEEAMRSFSSIYNFLADYIPRLRFTTDEEKAKTRQVLTEVIENAIKQEREKENPSDTIVGKMVAEKYDDNQIISMILTLFVAGQDNVSTSLIYAILKLAQDLGLQQKIREEKADPLDSDIIESLISEGLRMLCPISGIGRTASKDLVMTLTKKNSNALVSKTIIKKGDLIPPIIYLMGKDPSIFKDPEKFNPERFKGGSFFANLKHKPFGDGPHMCPGWYLYYVIAKIFLSKLVMNNKLTTSFQGEPKQKVGVVIGIADNIPITLGKI